MAERATFEPERTMLAYRGGGPGAELVGTAAAFTRRLAVPGALLPACHVSMVAVAPTARRQGVLSALMDRQLHDILAAGVEPVAALWATEGRIYQRFGYALASQRMKINIDNREVRLRQPVRPAGRLRRATVDDARPDLTRIYARVYPDRPGYSERHSRTWDYLLADPPSGRGGMSRLRVVLHDGPDGPDGFALYRVKLDWSNGSPSGTVSVHEVVTADPVAYAQIWQYLLTMDLTRTVSASNCAPDEPLTHMASDPRQLGGHIADALWLRVVDLAHALRSRAYSGPADAVLEVTDPLLPANTGRWRLTVTEGSATCAPSTDPADLRCDIGALGAAYLGGTSFTTLAAAGRATGTARILAELSTAFGWHRAPTSPEIF
jgi:predicted acetyltransferase